MSEEILINITPMESRVALVENGVLQEVHVERTQKRGIVGNIYKGKVVRVLPGMQAAFVDIGLERAAFIHAAEISSREGSAVESISALVHEGQSLVVQVTKDPIGTKGARLTTQLSIPSRYLVYMPRTAHVGISLKIEDEGERERLKQVVTDCIAQENIQDAGGFILRTAAEGAGADEIYGNEGIDTADFSDAVAGVTITLNGDSLGSAVFTDTTISRPMPSTSAALPSE